MKIVQINATCGVGSTGKICIGISRILEEENIENYILYSSQSTGCKYGIKCSGGKYIKFQSLKSKILGNYGFNSKKATRIMINEIEKINPDIVHIHNIHGHDCDLYMLFSYFKDHKTKLVWTFHDCWAFTGYCTHFAMMNCYKWHSQCYDCVQKRDFSWFCDRSKALFEKKKRLFQGLDLTIVTPSQWLANLVKQSFLNEYPVHTIKNGIDLNIFKPLENDVRQKYDLENKKVILGVAFDWGRRKGIDVFVQLSKMLPDDYKIILIGANAKMDKLLPKNVLSIHRTKNQRELAEFYSAADVFVNPTREDTYPTVNMESLACGTPVLTFRTGGSPEMLDETCGSVVDCDDIEALKKEIVRICEEKPYSEAACLYKAKGFDTNERFKEYVDLYEEIDT